MSRFISYLTQSSNESTSPTFKSYIDDVDGKDADEDEKEDEVESSASEFFDSELMPSLLPGEHVLGEADSVLKYTPFTDEKQGMSGKLCATNFKISFVTSDRSSYEMPGKRQRNQLIDDDDIPLTAIDSIYQVGPNARRKKLTPGTSTSVHTKQLEIHCKDFRIHTFSFRFTSKAQSKKFTDVLIRHAFASKDSLLFAHMFSQANQGKRDVWHCDTPLFDCITDWEDELRRCRCEAKWRVADVNISFQMSTSLPQYFVVPISLFNQDLLRAAPQFNNRRVPTWSYTHINGNSLVRMTSLDPNTAMMEFKQRMLDAVKVAGDTKNSPAVIDLNENMPTCKDVQDGYSKLKKLCLIHSKKDFAVQDLNWYSSLEDTKWLGMVRQCLTRAQDVADQMVNKKRTIVLEESSGIDFSCLISSLVQILLDPYYRSQAGFQALVQREWVKMGHPFQKYLVLVSQSETDQVPIFLLFLDCVWQLLKQFPGCFAFTETYLTTLWDSAHIGLFETFLFDNDHQRALFESSEGRNIRKLKLPPVWLWRLQYGTEDLSFFNDPLYVLTHDPQLIRAMSDTRLLSKPGKRSQLLRNNVYSRKLNDIYNDDKDKPASFDVGTLSPQTVGPLITLWTQCYLRWQAPAQILSGGTPASYLQQCHMVEEILHLHHKSMCLQQSSRRARPQSELIFSYGKKGTNNTGKPHITELLNSTYLTSSFPFSPGPSTKEQQMTFTPTLSMYLQNTALEYEKFNDVDD